MKTGMDFVITTVTDFISPPRGSRAQQGGSKGGRRLNPLETARKLFHQRTVELAGSAVPVDHPYSLLWSWLWCE